MNNDAGTSNGDQVGQDVMKLLKPLVILPQEPSLLEQVVLQELEQVRATYEEEEANFVQHQLQFNPIVEQRRPSMPGADARRAEACRRSRYNGKVKKASLRYKQQFIAENLCSSATILKNMQDLVANLEQNLLANPKNKVNQSKIQTLKRRFNLNSS